MAFNVPINSIAPYPTPSDWVRPADWITITDTPNEVQFLVCDLGVKAFTIRTAFTKNSGTNIYIDWGDGVVDTISTITSTDTSHVYSTGGTPCSRGYNTWKIRVYGDATCVINNAIHVPNFANTGGSAYYNCGLLEAYYGDGACTTVAVSPAWFYSQSGSVGNISFSLLEYVKLPAIVTWTTQMQSMFAYCSSLYKVVMPTSASALTSLNNTFGNCYNLLDITLPSNATLINNLGSTFVSCYDLRTVNLPTTLNSCITFANTFQACYALKNITLPSINLVTDFTSAFSTCYSLQWVKFNSLPAPVSVGTTVTMQSAFFNCSSLQNVYFPSSCSTNARYNFTQTFSSCVSLKNIFFPTGLNATTIAQTFQNCYSITSIGLPTTMNALITLSSAFSNCYQLSSITLPTTVGASISLNSTFSNCYGLKTITIPSAWVITDLGSTFNGCNNITSIVLPNNAQNSVVAMSGMCNQCFKLQSIVMPTSLNSANSLSTVFNQCSSLTSVVFPATMNAVSTMGNCFNNCYSLQSVTLPTSVSSCTVFSGVFQNCFSIKNITMPSTVSASVTTYSAVVSNCISLVTLTLPTTQTTGVTSIINMFSNCGNLTTINNLDKVGSLTATPLVNGTIGVPSFTNLLTSITLNCPLSTFTFGGTTTNTNFNRLNSLRLLNTGAGQYTGTSPQINVSYCDLGVTALNQLFTDLPTVTAKTINITGCTGAAGCTRTIATAKGWTVTG